MRIYVRHVKKTYIVTRIVKETGVSKQKDMNGPVFQIIGSMTIITNF